MHIFRHIAPKLLEIRQYSCVVLMQSDEKSDCAICAPDLISASLIIIIEKHLLFNKQLAENLILFFPQTVFYTNFSRFAEIF